MDPLPHFTNPISVSTAMFSEIGSSLWCNHILRTKIRSPDGSLVAKVVLNPDPGMLMHAEEPPVRLVIMPLVGTVGSF